MKILISIEHPAWAHQFKHLIYKLKESGHTVEVLAVNKDGDLDLLDKFRIPYHVIAGTTGKSKLDKAFLLFLTTFRAFVFCLKFRPDIFLGCASPLMAINAFIYGKKYFAFEDTERNYESLFLCKLFANQIITPQSFSTDLGKKHIRLDTYKELFYLHPDYFQPDQNIKQKLGLQENDKYTLVRFVSWSASHDLGYSGLSTSDKIRLVKTLEKYGKVYISSECKLPEELQSYEYPLPADTFHSAIYNATLVFTEGRTVASEAAVLGTHSVYYNLATEGYTSEQEQKYGLVNNYKLGKENAKAAIDRCEDLLKNRSLFQESKIKREKLLSGKVDANKYFMDLIERVSKKKILISVEHPAWAHQFKNIIYELKKRGHTVEVLAVNKDGDLNLLEKFKIPYHIVAYSTGKTYIHKAVILIQTTVKAFVFCLKYKPDLFFGRASPLMAINAFVFNKKHIVFEDTENNREALYFCRLFSSVIVTPVSFAKNLGKKHIRLDSYKELFYLHPRCYTSNPQTIKMLGVEEGEVYTLVRFVSWDASHDLGYTGFTDNEKIELINKLIKYGKVFISSESPLPPELSKYKFPLSLELFHDCVYYATLVFTEGRTVASEAAVLGTHSVYYNLATEGYTSEQEQKYGLVNNYKLGKENAKAAIAKCEELLQNKNLFRQNKERRKVLVEDKVYPNDYFVELIEKYLNIKT